jgi:hypothetical protein
MKNEFKRSHPDQATFFDLLPPEEEWCVEASAADPYDIPVAPAGEDKDPDGRTLEEWARIVGLAPPGSTSE